MEHIGLKAKRMFDFLLAALGLVSSSCCWVVISIAIIIEDGWPVIIRQKRIGMYGRLFDSFKFRSMKKSTLREQVNVQALENDHRITKVGRILRKCAFDELPQLVNILLGDMSFVGPRALLPVEIEVRQSNAMQEQKYANGGELLVDAIPGYDQRITVRPGLTGIAQVWAPRDILRRHKFKYDLLYIRKRSFWLDLRLLSISFLITFNAAWERRGSKLKLQNLR